jgi:hypothetical protein
MDQSDHLKIIVNVVSAIQSLAQTVNPEMLNAIVQLFLVIQLQVV